MTMTTRTKKSPALVIAERAYARELVKRAISDEAMTGRSDAAAQTSARLSAPSITSPLRGQTLGAKPPQAPRLRNNNPSVVGEFFNGMGRGVQNMAGGMKNFAVGALNFAVPGAAGVLAQASPHANIRAQGREWLQQSLAGARNTAESFGQFVGVNNAFDKDWRYVGAQAPQHLAQHRQQIQDKYFSNPKDKDLQWWYQGANNAADNAAGAVPAVATGQAAVGALARVPAIARAGTAAKTMIEGNRFADDALRATSVATGLPLHPAALPNGSLSGAMGLSQMGQYYAPLAAMIAAKKLGAPDVMQTIGEAQQYFPAVAADNVVRETVHPEAPEYLDYWTNPGAAMSMPVLQAGLDLNMPRLEAQQQQQYEAWQRQQQQQLAAQQPQPSQQQPQQADPPQVDPTTAPVDAAPEQAAAPAQTAADASPAAPAPDTGVKPFTLPDDTPPEVRAQVDAGTKQVQELPDEDKATASAALQKPDGPEADALKQRGAQKAVEEAANDPNNPPPQDPQGYGQWVGGVMDNFQKMDTPSQIAMGLGLGMGLLGLISSLGGEGGMGSFLMSALGLGVAGAVGAGAGMFGDEGVRMYGQGMRTLGNLAGMNIPEGEHDLSALLSGDFMSAAASGGGNPAEKLKQLEMLTQQPRERAVPLLMALDPKHIKTQADAQMAYDNAVKMNQQLRDMGINADNAQQLQETATAVQQGASELYNKPVETLGNWGGAAADAAAGYLPWGRKKTQEKEKVSKTMDFKNIIDTHLLKQAAIESAMKAARCWAGYEPVPGKKPYTDGSCRPAGSKKKKTEAKKEAASSVFQLKEKQPEAVVNNAKPSTEASKMVSVNRADPAKKEDLRPEEAQPSSKK